MRKMHWLMDFFEVVEQDPCIGIAHICLYVTWVIDAQDTDGLPSVLGRRKRFAARARISERTFDKCMQDLIRGGYIVYTPSKNASVGSMILLKRLL